VTVPVQAVTGPVIVVATGGLSATSAVPFTVEPGPARLDPPSGPAGSSFSVIGTGLAGARALTLNGTSLAFNAGLEIAGGVPAGEYLTVTVPAGASTGPVQVTTADGLSLAKPPVFTVTTAPAAAAYTAPPSPPPRRASSSA